MRPEIAAHVLAVLVVVMLASVLLACGPGEEGIFTTEDAPFDESETASMVEREEMAMAAPAATAAPFPASASEETEEFTEKAGEGESALLAGSDGLFQKAPLSANI